MKKAFLLLAIFSSFIAIANDKSQNMVQLIESFTDCDSSFFSNISNYKNELEEFTIVNQVNDHLAYFPVLDRTKANKNYQFFSQPMKYQSLSIVGYYDSALHLDKYGDYYFWGFIVDNTIDEIKTDFPHLAWLEMEKDLLYTTNSKVRYSSDNLETWHENTKTIVGVKTMPIQGTTEKLLLLEKDPDMTLLVCSIQGFFTPELLEMIRPDLHLENITPN